MIKKKCQKMGISFPYLCDFSMPLCLSSGSEVPLYSCLFGFLIFFGFSPCIEGATSNASNNKLLYCDFFPSLLTGG